MSKQRKMDMHEQQAGTEPDVEELHDVVYREKTEPFEGGQPVPVEMIVAAFALLMFGGWYLGNYSADFAVDRYEGPAAYRSGDAGDFRATPTEVDPMLMGKRVYNNCLACHQSSGQGVARQFPPLDANPVVNGRPDNLARIVLHGLTGPIEVAGERYNSQMPKWSQLDDRSLASVLTYIRASWSNDSPPVGKELVAEVRRATSGRSSPWTAAELESAPIIEVAAPEQPAVHAQTPAAEPSPTPAPPPTEPSAPPPTENQAQSESVRLGKQVFQTCAACHQFDGQGIEGRYPPLDGNPVVNGRPDNVARIVLRGLHGPVQVNGKKFDGQMPPWSQFSDRQLAAVMTYVRGNWNNDSSPISEALVAAVREATRQHQGAWTLAELETTELIEVQSAAP